MTEREAIDKIKQKCFTTDTEEDHVIADGILCELLTSLGYSELVEEYNKVSKWYA